MVKSKCVLVFQVSILEEWGVGGRCWRIFVLWMYRLWFGDWGILEGICSCISFLLLGETRLQVGLGLEIPHSGPGTRWIFPVIRRIALLSQHGKSRILFLINCRRSTWNGDQLGRGWGTGANRLHMALLPLKQTCQLWGWHVFFQHHWSPKGQEDEASLRWDLNAPCPVLSWVLSIASWLGSLPGIQVQPWTSSRKGASNTFDFIFLILFFLNLWSWFAPNPPDF